MPLPQQPASYKSSIPRVVYPDTFPRIPEEELSRNEALRTWQGELDAFWFELKTALLRERETLLEELEKLKNPPS